MDSLVLPDLLARRRQVMGPTYGLFYQEPIHLVRGEGVWLYDAAGRTFLDAYNNVPVVGHSHPYVVAAMEKQARLLNTHTRYLADAPVELAERILATLPDEIGNVIFTCTGSESNDLAVRVSKVATGGTGFIVTQHAYHGTTETTSGLSPSAGVPLGPDVFQIEAPIEAETPSQFGDRVRQCVQRMKAKGVRPAGLFVDTIFSSDGVFSDPAGFLADAVDAIHEAGGLFIADEVQPGFGRTGAAMWGFQRHGVVPDIVTMGKPMGNGHPIAAIATRPELMVEFAKFTRYFNTFGGNTVSCATALAVLDVLSAERLIENAHQTGAYLRRGLETLATDHPVIGAIRGNGLFLGVDIHANPANGNDGRQETARIVNAMRRHGVLIGTAGRNVDVLKIRPPLVIQPNHVDHLLNALTLVMVEGTAPT